MRRIARRLDRSPSTINREARRNKVRLAHVVMIGRSNYAREEE
ncbi:MAG: helix-turn-helix domain-containing protein [Gammaproteobacteria bacterium]|nr:helix-turn-helix domain-containing protein [Gammaproteobacteria bacterium]MBQ0838188.1 helix-turn-helix domain-containing protein [Gammaproteobacteria bacterium]